jgi:sugar O-acyltransferase (sialic acid O-acetyltransferase NeuD family)
MSKAKILLIGGGGHCHSVIDVVEQQGIYEIYGIVDVLEKVGSRVLDYKVIGYDDDLIDLFQHCPNAVITMGHIKSNTLRVKLFETVKQIGYELPTIISPLAYVSRHAQISPGTVVMHQALVNANAKIGDNCIINTKALIEHDVSIGNHCHIATAAVINGGVVVRDNTFVGSNSVVVQEAQVINFVKAGSIYK